MRKEKRLSACSPSPMRSACSICIERSILARTHYPNLVKVGRKNSQLQDCSEGDQRSCHAAILPFLAFHKSGGGTISPTASHDKSRSASTCASAREGIRWCGRPIALRDFGPSFDR